MIWFWAAVDENFFPFLWYTKCWLDMQFWLRWDAALLFNGCEAASLMKRPRKRRTNGYPTASVEQGGGGPPRVFAEWLIVPHTFHRAGRYTGVTHSLAAICPPKPTLSCLSVLTSSPTHRNATNERWLKTITRQTPSICCCCLLRYQLAAAGSSFRYSQLDRHNPNSDQISG